MLKALLPLVDRLYCLDDFSAAEAAAFEKAFDDGFGLRSVKISRCRSRRGLIAVYCVMPSWYRLRLGTTTRRTKASSGRQNLLASNDF
jgi:hypothetical protein